MEAVKHNFIEAYVRSNSEYVESTFSNVNFMQYWLFPQWECSIQIQMCCYQ